ncbi:PhnA-like protein [Methylobacterium segetis]|uniref:PhnA-like protein n=1 Tax=Methylobacterium segetis TaxID=2488750 RepID=UPI0010472615|nr:PhnA-like protein [Methylobacterium segetis]
MADLSDVHRSPVTPGEDLRTIALHHISWGAILGGVFIALILQLILNLLGLGLGLTSVSATEGNNPDAGTISVGAGLWWVVSGIVAAAAGGYTAGRLSGKPVESTAGYHGLISWAVTTFVVIYLLTSALGGLVGGAFSTVTSALGGVGQAAGGAVQTAAQAAGPALPNLSNPFSDIEGKLRGASGGQDPAALRDQAVSALRDLLTGDPARQQAAKDKAADAVAKAQGIPPDQAKQQVQQYQDQYDKTVADAKEKAKRTAEMTRKAAAQGALYAALALLIGGAAAFFAGRAGAVNPTLTAPGMGTGAPARRV